MSRVRRNRSRPLIALSLLAFASGCQGVGIIADKIIGQPEVPAQYVPNATLPLLIIAETYSSPNVDRADADRLSQYVSDVLEREKVATIIEPSRVAMLRDAKSPAEFSKLTVVDIARGVGARQVIYIDLTAFGVGNAASTDLLKGSATARVSVIDVDEGRAVYPTESGGQTVAYATPMRRSGDRANEASVRAETLAGLGDRVAKLFYKWKPGDNEMQTGTDL